MPVPFQSASWKRRSALNMPTIFGALSGAVGAAVGGSLDPVSGVAQVFGQAAHDFTQYFNVARASLDEGATWTDSYRGDSAPLPAVVMNAWSLETAYGLYHFQARWRFEHSFFLADGDIRPGYVSLFISSDGVSFSPHQDLYTWPAVNPIPAASGGQAHFEKFPGVTAPILIPGSGPVGEDAWWIATNMRLVGGGSSNPFVMDKADLWYSTDGVTWVQFRDLTSVPEFSSGSTTSFAAMFLSRGRVFVRHGVGLISADDSDDLLNTEWTAASGLTSSVGDIFPMYGGTLLTVRHGSLISDGFARVSCDNGLSFVDVNAPTIPIGRPGFPVKIGPAEAIIVTNGTGTPSLETVAYYSADGGETWAGGEVWAATSSGETAVFAALRQNGTPIVFTGGNVYSCTDLAQGVLIERTVCPLANAGLAQARRLVLCGGVITPDCQEG